MFLHVEVLTDLEGSAFVEVEGVGRIYDPAMVERARKILSLKSRFWEIQEEAEAHAFVDSIEREYGADFSVARMMRWELLEASVEGGEE